MNVRSSAGYSLPDATIPAFLHNSPDWLKKHILPRLFSTIQPGDI